MQLTEKGKDIYYRHYESFKCKAPKLKVDDEGYAEFQIWDFMSIFGEHFSFGSGFNELPCNLNVKIEVEKKVKK